MSDLNKAHLKHAKALAEIAATGYDTSFINNDVYNDGSVSFGQTGGGNDFYWRNQSGSGTVSGGDGSDILMGGSGSNQFLGGSGMDAVAYINATAGVTVHLDPIEASQNTGYASGDTYNSIENVVGSKYDDSLFGNGLANRMYGGDGFDLLVGNGGIDKLYGGNGDDTLFVGGGYPGADQLDPTGNFFREEAHGDAGNDTLYAGINPDLLDGGTHYRFALGVQAAGGGGDVASYALSNAAVNVNLSAGTASGGYAQGDTLTGIENLSGSNYGDTLVGNSVSNILEGGRGNDRLTGGGSSDTFWYDMATVTEGQSRPNFGNDIVTDFHVRSSQTDPIQDQLIFANGPADMNLQFTQVGADTVVTSALFDGSITLLNVQASAMFPF